jgi:hypothetical protein
VDLASSDDGAWALAELWAEPEKMIVTANTADNIHGASNLSVFIVLLAIRYKLVL